MPDPIIIVVIVLAVALVAAVVIFKPGRRRDPQSLYTEGLDHLLRGNLKQAYKCFKGVIERDTDQVAAYLKMGQVLRLGGVADKALKLHESLKARTTLSSYDRLELYKNLALDYSALGQPAKAVEWGRAVLKLDKRNTWALRHLVKFHRQLGDWVSVGKYLARWQKAKQKEDPLLQALCRFRQGYDRRRNDPPETVRSHYQQALKIDQGFSPAHYYLAESFADEVAGYRRELTTVEDPSQGPIDERRQGELNRKIGKLYPQAVAHWSSFVELSPLDTYRVLHRVEEALYFLQRFDDVGPFLRKVLDKNPQNLDGIAALANFYVRKGELDQAEQLLATIPQSAADDPLINAIRLKLKYRRGSEENLLPELDRLIDSIRSDAQNLAGREGQKASLMSWLVPDSDPLEKLA
ncbi:MAG: tetratricopeptide repeat protein [Candidatus Marinimicrobia bacterium]|nr:tetratricopeptide repeat protein [Candidatus Neomarinimicrobiota bacterium]